VLDEYGIDDIASQEFGFGFGWWEDYF